MVSSMSSKDIEGYISIYYITYNPKNNLKKVSSIVKPSKWTVASTKIQVLGSEFNSKGRYICPELAEMTLS